VNAQALLAGLVASVLFVLIYSRVMSEIRTRKRIKYVLANCEKELVDHKNGVCHCREWVDEHETRLTDARCILKDTRDYEIMNTRIKNYNHRLARWWLFL
jgi:hypothetical protein